MQSIDEFMCDFFLVRTAAIKKELELHEPFRQKFFFEKCAWDKRESVLKRSEAEKVLKVLNAGGEAKVVTEQVAPYTKLCYHLKMSGESWLIFHVDVGCIKCNGSSGDYECPICFGNGWCGKAANKRRP